MDTRQAPRLPISESANLSINPSMKDRFNIDKDCIQVQIIDISAGGIGLSSRYFIPRGIKVNLEFKIKDKLINADGEVRSAVSGGHDLTRLGVTFLNIKDEDKQAIKDFIKKHEKRSHPRLGI